MAMNVGEHDCYIFIPVYMLLLWYTVIAISQISSTILSFLRSKLSARHWLQAHTGGAGQVHCGLLQWVGTGSTLPRGSILCDRGSEMG